MVLQTGSALAVVLALGACSSVPDAINPVEWGKSVGDMFDGDDETAGAKSEQPIPGEDGEYPSLADTPSKPIVTGDQERDALIAGLAADRANAQYSQSGRRQSSAPVNALQNAPEVPVAQPIVTPAPTTPVTTSAMAAPTSAATTSATAAATAATAAATTSAVTSAPTGSSIADEWNAKSAASGTVPTPVAAPAEPNLDEQAAIAEAQAALDAANSNVARQQQLAAYEASQAAPVSTGDPVMDQYQRRLAEGQGVFANEPAATIDSGLGFDYSMYSDDGSVVVDQSQLGGGSAGYDESGMMDQTASNSGLASRLGVGSVDQLPPAINGMQIAQIQFGHGSTNLGGSDYSVLQQVASTWQQTGGVLRVIGHASMRTGNMSLEHHMAVNRRVSEGRASAVVSRLLSLGVAPDAIFVGADGSADPRYYEGVPAGEAGNRRVEIYLDY
ncbi:MULTISPECIES: OmpA family protein [Thalassospira]|nr:MULTISPECIES: OmpA family protein [Thalassospira]MDG4719340.1 OmpA family protein [Thalassospira sp. FZY0004]